MAAKRVNRRVRSGSGSCRTRRATSCAWPRIVVKWVRTACCRAAEDDDGSGDADIRFLPVRRHGLFVAERSANASSSLVGTDGGAMMPGPVDQPRRLAAAGVPSEADDATLRHEREQRGWRVQVEEPLRDDVVRGRGRAAN